MVKTKENVADLLEVFEESDPEIRTKLYKESKYGDVFLSIIATYTGVKISPSKQAFANLGLSEEFDVESVIEKIKECQPNCTNLYLLINSPGGMVSSSYKIARALRKNFKNIIVFVPHIAASGGTLLAITGNEIVMGMMSQLSPLDPQNGEISALSVERSFNIISESFRTLSEDDAPYTLTSLAEKFDPAELDYAISSLDLMEEYVIEILEGAGYKKEVAEETATKLVREFKTHSHVITMDRAKYIGLQVVDCTKYLEIWNIFRQWLSLYIRQGADKHIIRYCINNITQESIKSNEEAIKKSEGD